jgi:hypothetical protein
MMAEKVEFDRFFSTGYQVTILKSGVMNISQLLYDDHLSKFAHIKFGYNKDRVLGSEESKVLSGVSG